MAIKKRITVGIPEDLYKIISACAEENRRTIVGEIEWRFRDVEEKGRVTDEQGN